MKNKILFCDDKIIILELTRGYRTTIDANMYNLIRPHRWHVMTSNNKQYAIHTKRINKDVNHGKNKCIMMHRLIMGVKEYNGTVIDHIDGDGLNNRKSNLRVCTHSENHMNQKVRINSFTGLKGVFYDKRRNYYYSSIIVNSKCIYLGSFESPDMAKKAYDNAAIKHFGEFFKS
jgi:hypothetical protein